MYMKTPPLYALTPDLPEQNLLGQNLLEQNLLEQDASDLLETQKFSSGSRLMGSRLPSHSACSVWSATALPVLG